MLFAAGAVFLAIAATPNKVEAAKAGGVVAPLVVDDQGDEDQGDEDQGDDDFGCPLNPPPGTVCTII